MVKVKITTLGIIMACKNIGLWLTSYSFLAVKADPLQFLFSFAIYTLISVPSDLYLLNKAHEKKEK